MQALTNIQADAIMDVVDQCKQVSELHAQKGRHERNVGQWRTPDSIQFGKRIHQDYKDAVGVLVDLYMVAFTAKVADDILEGVLSRNLPSGLSVPLTGDTKEFQQVEGD